MEKIGERMRGCTCRREMFVMRKLLSTILLALGILLLGGTAPSTASVADAASVYAYSGKGICVYVDTSSITQTKGGFAVYVNETNAGTYTLMQFYKDLGNWKFTSSICGNGVIYEVAPAKAVFDICQNYL